MREPSEESESAGAHPSSKIVGILLVMKVTRDWGRLGGCTTKSLSDSYETQQDLSHLRPHGGEW